MPAESSVEYSANSKTPNVSLVYPSNESHQNASGTQETSNASAKGALHFLFLIC